MSRRLVLLALPLALTAVAGCGNSTPAAPRAAVRVSLSSPGDLSSVRTASVTLNGTVSPATALVRVRGQRVAVRGGAFTTTVSLEAGTNVIDVLASAPDARPSMSALRVRRIVTVQVPDVTGDIPSQATERLAGLGLTAQVDQAGGVFDALLPGDPVVCEMEPSAGTEVKVGTSVRLLVAKGC